MKIFRLVFLTIILCSVAVGQQLISSASNGTLAVKTSNDRSAKVFGTYSVPKTTVAIDLHKISYTSTDEDGKPVTLTGLISMPRGGAPKGLVVFCHGTIQDRENSPSFWKGKQNGAEHETATLAFAAGGYAVVMPDYLGLGDHKAVHPYPRNIVNSQSAVDIIAPTRELARQQNYALGTKLYVTGYSEGGGIAMAAMQKLEAMNSAAYHVERAAPASGPYDMSGATRDFMLLQPTAEAGFVVRLYLLSYAAYYLKKKSDIPIANYFKKAMADSIFINYNLNPTDKNLLIRLGLTARLMRSKNSLFNVITPELKTAMETRDAIDPLVAALLKDNVFDWAPRTPMLLINLESDGVVSPQNSANAFNAMRRRGVGANTLRRHIIPNAKLDHITAVPAAMSAARAFFDGGFPAVRTSE